MSATKNRRIERWLLSAYGIIAVLSATIFVSTQYLFVTAIGVAWTALALFWLCFCLAIIVAIVIISLNILRAVQGNDADKVSIILSILMLASLSMSIIVLMYTTNIIGSVIFGALGLIVGPLALIHQYYRNE